MRPPAPQYPGECSGRPCVGTERGRREGEGEDRQDGMDLDWRMSGVDKRLQWSRSFLPLLVEVGFGRVRPALPFAFAWPSPARRSRTKGCMSPFDAVAIRHRRQPAIHEARIAVGCRLAPCSGRALPGASTPARAGRSVRGPTTSLPLAARLASLDRNRRLDLSDRLRRRFISPFICLYGEDRGGALRTTAWAGAIAGVPIAGLVALPQPRFVLR